MPANGSHAAYQKRSPELATADDVRLFQLHLIESGLTIQNRNRTMTGVRFLLKVTMRRLEAFERGIVVIPRDGRRDIEHLVKAITRDLDGLRLERILVALPSIVDRQDDQ